MTLPCAPCLLPRMACMAHSPAPEHRSAAACVSAAGGSIQNSDQHMACLKLQVQTLSMLCHANAELPPYQVHTMQMYKSVTAPEKDAEGNRIPIASSLSRRFRRDERPSLSPRSDGAASVRAQRCLLRWVVWCRCTAAQHRSIMRMCVQVLHGCTHVSCVRCSLHTFLAPAWLPLCCMTGIAFHFLHLPRHAHCACRAAPGQMVRRLRRCHRWPTCRPPSRQRPRAPPAAA